MKRECSFLRMVTISILIILLVACGNEAPGEPISVEHSSSRLILATTTSTYDSGLLDYILPDFENRYGVTVDVIAVGTGQALKIAANGDADVLLVHAREREEEFVNSGHGIARYDVMYNDFVVLGPPYDPASIGGYVDAVRGFTQIVDSSSIFVSRGDDSGTDIKEKSIWAMTDRVFDTNWYYSTGQGMGAVLTIADELQAYTLSDRATYLVRKAEGLALEILIEGDPALFNPYGVIAVNPEKHPTVNTTIAQNFVSWITSVPTQDRIANFTVENQTLFMPDSVKWHAVQNSTR